MLQEFGVEVLRVNSRSNQRSTKFFTQGFLAVNKLKLNDTEKLRLRMRYVTIPKSYYFLLVSSLFQTKMFLFFFFFKFKVEKRPLKGLTQTAHKATKPS